MRVKISGQDIFTENHRKFLENSFLALECVQIEDQIIFRIEKNEKSNAFVDKLNDGSVRDAIFKVDALFNVDKDIWLVGIDLTLEDGDTLRVVFDLKNGDMLHGLVRASVAGLGGFTNEKFGEAFHVVVFPIDREDLLYMIEHYIRRVK
jgi:IMP cyclohydrolase